MREQKTVLITNDDSIDSPFLELAINSLAEFCEILIAVPATEHSWKGKSMTRHGSLKIADTKVGNFDAWTIEGTPADCVNLAIHNLAPRKPDLVISGINIGKNIGLGFCLASGTVGACLEANIADIPAIALSQELVPSDFLFWDKHRRFPEKTEHFVKKTIPTNCALVWDQFGRMESRRPITWNINFPYKEITDATIAYTKLSRTFYGQCFNEDGNNSYKFGLARANVDNKTGTDVAALEAGNISATLIDMTTIGQVLPSAVSN